MTKYSSKYKVICSDIDMNSQMQTIAIPTYFQDCFIRYAAKNNFATFDIKTKDLQWFISEYKINLAEDLPYWSENFIVETWIAKISKLKVIVEFTFKHNGVMFANGQSTWLLFDNKNRQPAKTNVLFADYTEIESSMFDTQDKVPWQNIKEPIRAVEHIANITDLDFNGHINNRSYVNIAITTASKEIRNACYIKTLVVKFLKQAFMNDKLICTSYATEQDLKYITKIAVNDEDVCKIYTEWAEKTNKKTILDYNLSVRNE